jgi:outer membrane protein OmpA-like peptidoglycan-associated protein
VVNSIPNAQASLPDAFPAKQTDAELLENLVGLLVELDADEILPLNPEKNSSSSPFAPPSIPATGADHSLEVHPSPVDLPEVSNGSSPPLTLAQLQAKIDYLERVVYKPTELINPLLPLIQELMAFKLDETRESLVNALAAVIDDAILQKSQQQNEQMGQALAVSLPVALNQRITHDPELLAKTLGPIVAQAIEEQIQVEPTAIAQTLGPQMGSAIKQQIVLERDSMVDALYPVIGSTISRFMVEFVQSVNEKIETTLSVDGIKRKIKARLQGVSEAELIVRESLPTTVQLVLLIHKASGLVIRQVRSETAPAVDSDMLAGMLTAIRSFVNECMGPTADPTELHVIEYNASKILVEAAGYCYLAVIVKGEPTREVVEHSRAVLGDIVLQAGDAIATYDGDARKVPNSIDPLLQSLINITQKPDKEKSPKTMFILLGILLVAIGFWIYRGQVAAHVERKTAIALDSQPELSVYRIDPNVRRGRLVLTGRVPNAYLQAQAQTVAAQTNPNWKIINQIQAVEVPSNPVTIKAELERAIAAANQTPGNALQARLNEQTHTIEVSGIIDQPNGAATLTQHLASIPGVRNVASTLHPMPDLETRLYFAPLSSTIAPSDADTRLQRVLTELKQNPALHLRIIGHADTSGDRKANQVLAQQRALAAQTRLQDWGIAAERLRVESQLTLPPGVRTDQPLQLDRCVRFEFFIP